MATEGSAVESSPVFVANLSGVARRLAAVMQAA
jgi:hypothetical protein